MLALANSFYAFTRVLRSTTQVEHEPQMRKALILPKLFLLLNIGRRHTLLNVIFSTVLV